MRIGKVELTQDKLIILVATVCLAIAVGTYFGIYGPLIKEVKTKYIECRSIEKEVVKCYDVIESVGRIAGERVLITEEDVSRAIDELTKHGKLNGINFISIKPKKMKKEKGSEYKILPVGVEIKSTYERLGTFLGSLDNLDKSLVKVKNFNITPDEKTPNKLITDLTMDIYLSGE